MIYAKLAFYAVLVAAIAYGGYHVADLKGKAATEKLQLAWDADKTAIQKAADAAIAQATKDRDAALAANEGIESDFQTQLSSARALNDSLAQRLRLTASTATGSSSVPKTGSGQQSTPAGPAPSLGQIDDAIAATLTECAGNRAQLNSLIAEIRPQL
jgi:hypothetical protein